MCCILFAALLSIPNLSRSQGISSPGGFGASGRTVYGGFVGNFTQPYSNNSNLAMTLGVGLGDPIKGVGVQIESSMLDLSDQSLYSAAVILHRVLQPGVSMAVGFENLISYSSDPSVSNNGIHQSGYFAVSHALGAKYPGTFIGKFTYSVGLGLGRYSRIPTADMLYTNQKDGTYIFGAIQYAVTKHLNLHTEWNGSNINAALSANAHLYKVPFSVLLGYMDLTNNSGDRARFMAGIGFSYNFKGLKSAQPETTKLQQILENQERQQLDAILKSAK